MRDKITVWKHKVKEGNLAMFSKNCECELKCEIRSLIVDHLSFLREELDYYFPNIEIQNYNWIKNPFLATVMIDFSLTKEEELAEIKNDQCLLLIYEEENLQNFWICVSKKHPNLAKKFYKFSCIFYYIHLRSIFFNNAKLKDIEMWKLENA
eukprot:XP_014774930.1 PREDICTED: zinc finger BED domain-containing protein 5-like [Octopus bimaculoides]